MRFGFQRLVEEASVLTWKHSSKKVGNQLLVINELFFGVCEYSLEGMRTKGLIVFN